MNILPYEYKANKVCTRCIMDDTVSGIQFDEKGECTFCKIHDELEAKYPLNEQTTKKLHDIVRKIKEDGKGKKYDCIVGVSGGRDSTYTLYNTVKLGLRPLAVHFDNGWNSEIAVQNIENACKKLNVDLHTHVADWEEFKDLQKAFLFASVPDAEIPTDWVIASILFTEAVQNNVSYSIVGSSFRTEGTTPLSWTYQDGRYLRDIHDRFGNVKFKSFPNVTLFSFLYYSFLKRISHIRLLYYLPYNEDEVLKLLRNELGWRDYGDKHHESKYTAFFQSYLLTRKFNIDKRKLHYSAKIRTHQITREHALEIIQQDPFTGGAELIEYCLKKLELSESEFENIMNAPIKSFLDYNSYYHLIKKLHLPVRWGHKIGVIPDTIYKKYFSFNYEKK